MNRIRQQGLALIAVLWLVAALGVIVTGMMQAIRTEARMTARARDVVFASMLGESAMQSALQAMAAGGQRPDKLVQDQVTYAGVPMAVQAMPLNGYIDINKAPVELLRQALQTASGLSQERADQLAHAIVEHRSTPGPSGKLDLFEAIEDLLRIPGIDYPIYAALASVITTDARGSGLVNPLAAPPQVLRVLTAGNDAAVAHFVAGREARQMGLDQSAMNGAWLDAAGADAVELTAVVPLADGGSVRVVRRYVLGSRRDDGLPWRVFYAQSFFDTPVAASQ